MNLHAPQTVEAQAEARNIMAVKYQIVSPQSNRPVMSVIQDVLLGSYLLTAPGITLDRETMMRCVICIPGWNGKFEVKEIYTGHDLITQVLPIVNWKRGNVEILRGKMLHGQLDKRALGTSHGSLIHVIFNDCGPDETILFIHRLQMVVHKWLDCHGFTIGIRDMLTDSVTRDNVHDDVARAFSDVKDEHDESKINQRLNICRDSLGKMVQEPMDDSNNFFCMVSAGSKGSSLNVSQIKAVVGQQNLSGSRIPKTWTDRTLPHFERGSNGPLERGFIQHSFVEGLKPHESFFLAISGREGIIDTACKTSTTGYLERRLIKALENMTTHWDKTVRNSGGMLMQFTYGDDGFDGMRIEKQLLLSYDSPIKTSILSETTQLLKDNEFVRSLESWKDPTLQGTPYFMLPVNVSRIVHNATTIFNIPSSRMTALEIYTAVVKIVDSIDNMMVKILIRGELNSKRMVDMDITKDNMEVISHTIKKQYELASQSAGESVGAIAAQSIGEPATQMTLNTFHFAGISSKNVTLGIPRLEEILNSTKGEKMKTPVTSLRAENMSDVVKKLKHVRVEDIVKSYKVTDCPDEAEIEFFMKFPDPEYKPCDANSTLVLYLHEWYDVLSLKRVIYATNQLVCAYTDGPTPVFHVRSKSLELDMDMYYRQHLQKATVRGITGAEYCKIVKVPGKPKYIETSLADLCKLFECDVKVETIYTNNVHNILDVLGVEAARAAIIREIRTILGFYGIYVNIRHILILADWVTSMGQLTPLTRHGIRRVDASPLKRSTFEEVVDVFNQAACYNEIDKLEGISECIIAGVPPNIGSKITDTIPDESIIEKHAVERPPPYEIVEFEPMEESNPWWTCDDPWDTTPQPAFGMPQPAFGMPQPAFGMPQPTFGMPQPTFGMPQPTFGMPQPTFGMHQVQLPGQMIAMPVPCNPPSPMYDPTRAHSPTSPPSPMYDPTRSHCQNTASSPLYSPCSPAYSPMSPAYSPTRPSGNMYSPTSPAYSPTSPVYSPTSPVYSPTSSHVTRKRKSFLESPEME